MLLPHLARNLLTFALLPVFAAALGAADDPAAPYAVGDRFIPFTTRDQHEKPVQVSPADGLRHLVVSFTMGTGKDANRFFEQQGAGWLEKHHAAFLADIHGMPGIGRVFALPKMKKYPHRILLGDDAHLLDRYPRRDGQLTVFDFHADGSIAAIRFLDPEKELVQLFR